MHVSMPSQMLHTHCCTYAQMQEVTAGATSGRRRRLQAATAAGVQVPVSIATTADQAGPVGTALQGAVSAGTLPEQLQQQGAPLDLRRGFCS